MEITKLDENKIEVETTEVKTEVLDLDNLLYDRDSLARTIDANLVEVARVNAEIQEKIDALDIKINQAKELGVKTDDEIEAIRQEELKNVIEEII